VARRSERTRVQCVGAERVRNPLEIADHDRDLRRTIELARLLGIDQIVCMSGRRDNLSTGGWLPGIDREVEVYWRSTVEPYWHELARIVEAARLRLCFELEPGAVVYNVASIEYEDPTRAPEASV
jgi:sugar phosphate isomerase/epimerase